MQDVVIHLPSWLSDNDASKQLDKVTVIFFLTGNPGLIGYYKTFLKLLAEGAGRDAVIAGISLGGFETSNGLDESPSHGTLLHPPSFERKAVYDLGDQIELCHARLDYLVGWVKKTYYMTADLPVQVILVGHSVGAYIALELVRKHNTRFHDQFRTAENASSNDSSYNVLATMLLTPTIHDIARSPSGKVATPILSTLPFFPALVQLGASILTNTLFESWLRSVVASVTGMKRGDGLDTTVAFLRTPGAVKQALHMARCEMLEIGEANWTEDIWGASEICGGQNNSSPESQRNTRSGKDEAVTWRAPQHFFLFAREDHWVASITRDNIIEKLGDRAKIVTDDNRSMGLVHAWCLQQSSLVAQIVNEWIEEALTGQQS